MLIKKLTYIVVSFLASCNLIVAQDSLLFRDYEFVKSSNIWLTGRNSAAITLFDSKNIAEADVTLTYGEGKLTEPGGAMDYLQLGASIESFYRISSKTVTYGSISYNSNTGNKMTGSVFMTQRMPFDIVEDSLSNSGSKHRDTYHLIGAVGADIWKGYSIGARIEYTSSNYAKYKDLRHKNKLMDIAATAGIFLPMKQYFKAGVDYTYHRHTESVIFSTYGNNEKVYKSLIDFGAYWGLVEQYGYDGFTDKSHEMPYFEDSHSGALAIEITPFPCHTDFWRTFSFYGNVALTHGTGYYGRRSPYTIAYTNHNRNIISADIHVSLYTYASKHSLNFSFSKEKLQNKMENFRALDNNAGSPHYEYYAPAETGDKSWYNISTNYTINLGIRGERPTWTISAGYNWHKRNISAYLYPFYRRQILATHDAIAKIERNIFTRKGVWTFYLKGKYREGNGEPFIDGTFILPAPNQPSPATMQAFLYQDFHIMTSPQYALGMLLKYSFRFPGTNMLTHIQSSITHNKSNGNINNYCGRDYTTIALSIGSTF